MLYEMRAYEPHEGKAAALLARFETHVVPLFARHGITLLGAFSVQPADGRLIYLTQFADERVREAAWAAFARDPEWQAIKAESERDGPLMLAQTVTILTPAVSGLALA